MPNPPNKPKAGGAAGKPAPNKPELPGQPGQQPGDEWGEDNPGNVHGLGVDDHLFFHRDGAGPHAGRVVAHGVHGCQVDDDAGMRHKVRWSRVLGVKKKAALPASVVDRGQDGAILQHPDGRRIFVTGELPFEDVEARFSDVAGLEESGRRRQGGPRHPNPDELEKFARSSADLTKALADHECEGPALCRVCAGRRERGAGADLMKAFAPGLTELEAAVDRLRSVGAGGRPLPRR